MSTRVWGAAAVLVAGLAVTGCTDQGEPAGPTPTAPSSDTPSATAPDSPEPSDSADPGAAGPDATDPDATDPGDAQVPQPNAAISDLAERLGVSASDVSAGEVEAVTWPSPALGCPSGGKSYPQVLTKGYRLTLTAAGKEYEYHSGTSGPWVYCENPQPPASVADRS